MRERRLVAVSFYCLDLFVLVYFSSRVNKFLRGLCPNGRMSCIGNYKRNVLDFVQTFYLVLVGVLFSIFKIVTILVIVDNSFHLPKKTTFWIWNLVEIVCNEGFYFFTIPFLIVVRPSYQARNKPASQFYVRRPIVEPWRPKTKESVLPSHRYKRTKNNPKKSNVNNTKDEEKKYPLILYCRSHQNVSMKAKFHPRS